MSLKLEGPVADAAKKVPPDSVRKSSRQAELRQSARVRFSARFAVADLRPSVVPHERQNMFGFNQLRTSAVSAGRRK